MTWTDIGPTETAAALLVDLMIELDLQRQIYEETRAPITAGNKALVIDELFEAWQFLCDKEPLAPSVEPRNSFAEWRARAGR